MTSILPVALHPLSRRLPLMMAAFLIAVVTSIVWIAAARLQKAVAGEEMGRLQASARRIATLVDGSVRRMHRDGDRLGAEPLLSAGGVASPAALDGVQRLLDAEVQRNTQTVAIAVWQGQRMIAASGPLDYLVVDTPQLIRRDGPATRASRVGSLRRIGDTVIFATVVPIMGRDSTAAPVGAIVAVRRLVSGNQAALYGQLIGRGARVHLGNSDGSLWSNFTHQVAGPSVQLTSDSALTYEDPTEGTQLAGVAPILGAPWVAMVAIDEQAATEPVRGFLLDVGWIAAIMIVAGVGLTWFTVRRSLRPLGALAAAAEGMATGHFDHRVPVTAQDEAGRLAVSFNAMAGKVSASQMELGARASALEAANTEIRESEAKYQGLVDHSPDGILIHRNGRILFSNPAAAELLGVGEPGELIGRAMSEFLQSSDQRLARERNRQVEAGGSAPPIEVALVRGDMRSVIVECSGIPIVVEGQPAVQAILHDVTERRQLEEQFQQSQKMEAVGRLAGGIAHDFNNLLTVIDSYSEFAMTDLEPGDPRREDIAEVRRAAATAAQLTRQLLAFSRKQGKLPQPLRLNDTIKGMIAMLKRLIGDNIRLDTVVRDNVPAIWADASQLQQVLLNLAVNARDAMPSGGSLRIETSSVTIAGGVGSAAGSIIPPGSYAMLLVHDTGGGMPPEVRARIFEPFFTTKQAGRGTGLGLSTVYGIVKQAQGHVWVDSAPGQGTTFKLYFPAYDRTSEEESEAPAAIRARHSGEGSRILIVEDDASVRQAVRRMLSRADLTVIEARDGAEALDVLERDRDVDLVITDMMMPGISGADLVVAISDRWPGLPLIIMSGYAEETGQKLRIPDSVAFVEKPIAPGELVEVVQRMLAPQPGR